MNELLSLWHAEHMKFGRLLHVLESQIDLFHEGQTPDYAVIGDIVFYLQNYADAFHHPREDVAFERLQQKQPSSLDLVRRLQREHRVIHAAGQELLQRLGELQSDAILPRSAIESSAATYLTYYRQHLKVEESEVMPMIDRLFSAQDWTDVANVLAYGPDPLFGDKVDERFNGLRQKIGREIHAGQRTG